MKMHLVKSKSSLLLGFGFLFLGGNGLILWPFIYETILNIFLTLQPGGIVYDVWTSQLDMNFNVNYFNWTNPEDIFDKSKKPKFREVGPYKFKEVMVKENITWDNENATVTFKMLKEYSFNADESYGPLSQKITTLHPLFMGLAYITRNWNYVMKKGISITMGKLSDEIFMEKPVGELTFDGFEDPLFDIASKTSFLVGINLPSIDRFGYFSGRNFSTVYEPELTMTTGMDNRDFGQLVKIHNKVNPGYFPGTCGNVKGGMEFQPPLNRGARRETVLFYIPEVCRDITFYFHSEVNYEGINGYKYVLNEKSFDNGSRIPEFKCYCPGDCHPSGIANISTCLMGVPVFLSLPHFQHADPIFNLSVEGMKPNNSIHESYVIIEPVTGIPLEVMARFQFNILLQPDDTISLFQDVPRVYLPVLWLEQIVNIPPKALVLLKLIKIAPYLGFGAFGLMFTIGLLMVTSVISQTGMLHVKTLFQRKKKIKCPELVPLTGRDFYGSKPKKFVRTNTCRF